MMCNNIYYIYREAEFLKTMAIFAALRTFERMVYNCITYLYITIYILYVSIYYLRQNSLDYQIFVIYYCFDTMRGFIFFFAKKGKMLENVFLFYVQYTVIHCVVDI